MLGLFSKFNIVVLGAGRGGTSLLGSLLDSHPKITLALEEFTYSHLVGNDLPTDLGASKRLDLFIERCKKASRQAPNTWGNKITTEQLDFLLKGPSPITKQAVFDTLLKPLKIIFIYRDGRACVHSKLNRTNLNYREALDNWKNSVDWLRFLRSQSAAQLYTLSFENLVKQPQYELTQVCQFLGLAYSPAMLKGTGSNRIASQYRHSQINAERAVVPHSALDFTPDMQAELEYLGYL